MVANMNDRERTKATVVQSTWRQRVALRARAYVNVATHEQKYRNRERRSRDWKGKLKCLVRPCAGSMRGLKSRHRRPRRSRAKYYNVFICSYNAEAQLSSPARC